MKINKLLTTILLLLVTLTACKKALDINDDPNYVAEADVKLLLPSGIIYSASRIGGDYEILGGFWAQHYAQNNNSSQYRSLDQYSITNTSFNTAWNNMWAGALKDLKIVIDKSSAAAQWNYYMSAKIISAFDYHILNDLYGAIPIQEGLSLETNAQPHFVASKEANGIIVAMLDDAISKTTSAKVLPAMGAEDFIFQGNIDNWVKFAKSLKLKILMRDFTANQAAIQTLLNENDLLIVDAKVAVFIDAENKSNPLYEQDRRKLNTAGNIRASNTLLTYLLTNNDPRVAAFYEKTGASETDPSFPKYTGLEQGDYTVTGIANEETSRAVVQATDPVYFMSAAEVAFLKAEAYARLGNMASAKTNYDAGITLAFQRWGLDATPFIAVGGSYAFTGGTEDQMIEQIIIQKWVASTRTQAWDAFFDQNRTGYPKISPVPTAAAAYVPGQYTISVNTALPAGQIPRRLLYPKSSSDYNPNTPPVVPLYEKMWWQK